MIKIEFEGWVEKKFEATQYDQSITVRNYKHEEDRETLKDKKEYPACYKFLAQVKNGSNEQLNDVHEGDKVKVVASLNGKSGVSKSDKYYCINELVIAKKDGIKVLARAEKKTEPAKEEEPDDMPF